MKRKLSLLLAVMGIFVVPAQDFTVQDFTVDIFIHEQGYFDVVEKYDLTFEAHKHGIYRTIRTSYDLLTEEGFEEKRKIRITRVEVPGYKYEKPFDFEQKLTNEFTIKIGDEDITLIGPQQYEIHYRVHNALLFEESAIRFYWNIKPDGWQADFHHIGFQVHLPENMALSENDCFVYSGYSGNTSLSEEFRWQLSGNLLSGSSTDLFISRPGQSVTLLINMPAGSIHQEKPFWPFWDQYGWVLLATSLFMGFYVVWKKYGKDERVVPTTSYYPPAGIDPAMAGFLINDKDDAADIIALLPYWGSRGLLEIEELPKSGWFGKKDTKLRCMEALPDTARLYEREIFSGLFGHTPVKAKKPSSSQQEHSITLEGGGKMVHKGKRSAGPGEVLVSSLKDSFYTTMNKARSQLKDSAQQYYEARSRKVKWISLAVLILATILLTLLGLFFWGLLAAVGLFLSCIILLFLNTYMIKRNPKGNRLLSELKGFREFIKIAEEGKLRMLLAEDPGYFESTMGYALAFGLFEKWAKKFAALHIPPPDWYQGSSPGRYNMGTFAKSFPGAMSGVQSTMVSSPSQSGGSSGGGSSGGGFGGGGGGSW